MSGATSRNRVQAGIPSGGQFAAEAKVENPDLADDAPDPDYAIEGKNAAQWREYAQSLSRSSAESFERSDTDGYLSQWALDRSADLAMKKARLAENKGLTVTDALFDLDGNLISTHRGWGEYGPWWKLTPEAAERMGRTFISPSQAMDPKRRRENNRKKGVTVGMVKVPGQAKTVGQDMISLRAVIQPDIDALKAGNFEVVTTDWDDEKHGEAAYDRYV